MVIIIFTQSFIQIMSKTNTNKINQRKRGGYDEERNERMRWNQEERRKLISSFHSMISNLPRPTIYFFNLILFSGTIGLRRNGSCEAGSEPEEPKSNDDDFVTATASNSISDDASICDEFQDIPEEHEELPAKDSETSFDLNNSDDFQECDDSDDSFVSSLEQIIGIDCPIPVSSSTEHDVDHLENTVSSCENAESSGLVLIEEIEEEAIAADKIIEKKLKVLSDDWSDDVDVSEKENSKESEELETFKDTETDRRGTSMKITFYCESVNKLTSDAVGEECEEIIQEITPTVDNI